jgi:glycosyltransferase involved in cell wall biosynthesis
MKFSILIANYNNGKYFVDCWNSLLKQTYTNWEAIIVDDCSTDDSLEIIKNTVNNDCRAIILLNDKNYGCGYTKKRCIDNANSELCAFLDPDDLITHNALQTMLDVFLNSPESALVYSNYQRCDFKLQPINPIRKSRQVENGNPNFFNLNGYISHFAVFKRSVYMCTAGIDEFMLRAVDQDLYLKLYEKGLVMFTDEVLYKYRVHIDGISTGTDGVNVTKADYWHWYAINSAAKRRGISVEKLFLEKFVNKKCIPTFREVI